MINNPRFPHTVTITRTTGSFDPFTGVLQNEEEVFKGEGRYYKSTTTREKAGVLVSDYEASIPQLKVDIIAGDKILVEHRTGVIEGVIIDCYTGNLGTTIYFNKANT